MVNFITTLAATLIGINNINDMKNGVSPATRNYIGALKSIKTFLDANGLREKLYEQSDLINFEI